MKVGLQSSTKSIFSLVFHHLDFFNMNKKTEIQFLD